MSGREGHEGEKLKDELGKLPRRKSGKMGTIGMPGNIEEGNVGRDIARVRGKNTRRAETQGAGRPPRGIVGSKPVKGDFNRDA